MRTIHELMDGTRRNEWDFRNASRLPMKQGTADNQTGASDWLRRADPCPVDRGCVALADKRNSFPCVPTMGRFLFVVMLGCLSRAY